MKREVISTGMSGMVGSRVEELVDWQCADMSLDKGTDITDKKQVEEFVDKRGEAKVLLHMAAFTDVNKAWEQKGDKEGSVFMVNVKGTQNLAEVCAQKGMHMIYISTDMVFSGEKGEAYIEEDEREPIEWYGQTKAWGEEKVEGLVPEFTIVRIAFPYRAGGGKLDLVDKIRRGLAEDSLYPQFTDMMITPTFIDDIAKALDEIVKNKPGGVFHVTGDSFVSTYQLAREVAEVFGFDKEKVEKGSLEEFLAGNPEVRPYQKSLKMDNSKLEEELGVVMSSLKEGLEKIKEQEAKF